MVFGYGVEGYFPACRESCWLCCVQDDGKAE